jgi:hypothetical protein
MSDALSELNLADLLSSPKRRRFAIAYAENGGNGTAAAEAAGFATPAQEAVRLLKDAKVNEAIARHAQVMANTAGESRDTVLARIINRARANVADIFVDDEHTRAEFHAAGIQHPKDLPIETQRCIKSISFNQNGVSKIEFYDSSAADRDLARLMGLEPKENEALTPDDAASLLAAAFDRMDASEQNAEPS